jgi:hypothetical protein
MLCRLVLLLVLALAAGCAQPVEPLRPTPEFAALGIGRVAVGPVAFAVAQPTEKCSMFIDEDLRSALVRTVRRHGYEAGSAGEMVPRSFAIGPPPPLPGVVPAAVDPLPGGVDGVLQVWVDEYWENSLCGWEGPKYLTIGATAALYAGAPPREVWRGTARIEGQGYYRGNELIWVTTTRLAEALLATLPAGPGR